MQRNCFIGRALRVCGVLSLCWGLTANAATLLVTNLADFGRGSLREVLLQANSNGPARIEVAAQGEIVLSSALPTITSDLTIVGPGAESLRLRGAQAFPLLSVADRASLVLRKVALVDGLGEAGGGALRNFGAAVLQACVLSNNVSTNEGGAILNCGSLVLDGCTLVSNRVFGAPGQRLDSTNSAEAGFNAKGGAICSREGTLWLTNCTVWGNLAVGGRGGDNALGAGGPGGAGLGGGLFWTAAGGTNWLVNCTLSANQVLGGEGGLSGTIFGPAGLEGWGTGGGIVFLGGAESWFLLNTLLAGNSADHALPDGYSSSPLQSRGGNLVGVTNGLTGFTAADLLGVDPQLSGLQAEGGPVPTCALPPGSPAIDHGRELGAPLLDARGVKRPQGDGIDIGAYEVGNQRILFSQPVELTYGDAPYLLDATATSELPVSLSVAAGPGFLSPTNNSLLVPIGAGRIWVVASQPGNELYLPAPNVTNVLVVRRAPLTVSANDAVRAYGTTNPAFSGTLAGVMNRDPLTVQFVSAATNTTPVGVYGPDSTNAITPVLVDPTGCLSNYTVLSGCGTLTITQALQPLVVTLPSTNRPYGAPNPPLAAILSNLLPWDTLTVAGTTVAGPASPVGHYAIVPAWNDPQGRLSNYTVVTNLGTLNVFELPSVSLLEPTNGAFYFTGMDVPVRARLENFFSPIQSVTFLVSNQLTSMQLAGVPTNATDFGTLLTNVAEGIYTIQAVVTNGAGTVFHSGSVSFAVADLAGTIGPVDITSLEVHQTGLYFQDIWLTNITSLPLPAVLVEVAGLRPGVVVYNAIGLTKDVSLVRFDYPTAPGQVLRLRIEYYVPNGIPPTASFALHLTAPEPVSILAGTGEKSLSCVYPFSGGTSLLQFRTVMGATYYVQYSTDLSAWSTAQPAVRGNDNWVEWLDNGPPKTRSLPANAPAGHRFYRVLRLP